MIKYTIKRIAMMIPAIIVIIFIIFTLIYFLPGSTLNMTTIYREGDALNSIYLRTEADANLFTRFLRYIYNAIVHQDFGKSSATRVAMLSDMQYRVRNTLLLLLSGVGITLVVGIPLGVYASLKKGRAGDRIVSIIALFLSAIPAYSIAMILALVFCVYLRLLPVIQSYNNAQAFLLPAVTIAIGGIASIARMTRTSMLEVLEQPFVTSLRAKGLSGGSVVLKHAIVNALVPIISTFGGFIAQLLCGTLVVEYFFNIPGLGTMMLSSLSFRNHYEILACTVFLTIILMGLNLVCDILYSVVNPQIRLRYTNRRTHTSTKEAVG